MIQDGGPGRLFVDVARGGCPCGCRYCFVTPGDEVLLSRRELEDLANQVRAHPRFAPGSDGTVLTFGAHCDLFRTQTLVEQFLLALHLLAPVGNPIQVATKQFVSARWATAIGDTATMERQVTVFVSCATIRRFREYERQTAAPRRRFESFPILRAAGIGSCLYLKPFLAGVIDRELDLIDQAVQRWSPEACCIGPLFVDDFVRSRLRLPMGLASKGTEHRPVINHAAGALEPPREFVRRLRLRCHPVPLFERSLCALAYIRKHLCSLHGSDCGAGTSRMNP